MISKLPGADCENCPGRDLPFVKPQLADSRARLAILSDRPGRTEIAKQSPFSGGSGRLLAKGVRYLGLDRSDVHWTYAVPCAVRDKDLRKARKACAGRLTEELADASPPVIMPVGSSLAIQTILGLRSAPAQAYRGTITAQAWTEGPTGGRWVTVPGGMAQARERPIRYITPTIHPATVMRQPLLAPILESDVVRIGRVLRHGWSPPERLEGRVIRYARTSQLLDEALHAMTGRGAGFDVETVGLGPLETSLVCFALSDGPVTTVVPWARTSSGSRPWWPNGGLAIAGAVSEWLKDRVAITHNGPVFDHLIAERYGIRIAAWEDTLIASHAWESHLPKGLARVASSYLDVGPWKTWPHNDKLTNLWRYNALDTLYTVLAWQAMKGRYEN